MANNVAQVIRGALIYYSSLCEFCNSSELEIERNRNSKIRRTTPLKNFRLPYLLFLYFYSTVHFLSVSFPMD